MTPDEITLFRYLAAYPPGIVSITGGGGKTTLLFTLAKTFAAANIPVICTTTTRMFTPDESEWLHVKLSATPDIFPSEKKALFVAQPPLTESPEKVSGYASLDVDRIADQQPGSWILVEADGSAQLPLKAPAAHEPVIPERTAISVAVLGLDCINRQCTKERVFRMREVAAITGLEEGDTITPKSLIPLLLHPNGLFKSSPRNAARLLLCNRSDLPGAEEAGYALAEEVAQGAPGFLQGFFVASLKTKGLACLSFPTAWR